VTDVRDLTDPMQNYFKDLENGIINLISERLAKISGANPDDLENLMKLQNINEDLKIIEKEIAGIIDKSKAEIYNIVEICAREYYEEAAQKFSGQLAAFGENHKTARIVEQVKRAAYECFADSFKSNVMGLITPGGEFRYFRQAYSEIVNDAVRQVMI